MTDDAEPAQPAPRPRSQAQIEASRANGARGRGPTTDEGKAASCRNALKHGLRAAAPVLAPDEDRDAFDALLADLIEEHAPQDTVEAALVRQLALAIWRLERVEWLEVEALSTRERRPNSNYAGGYHPGSPSIWDARRLETVVRYRAQVERNLHRTLKALQERQSLREDRTNEPKPTPPATPPSHKASNAFPAGRSQKAKKRKKRPRVSGRAAFSPSPARRKTRPPS